MKKRVVASILAGMMVLSGSTFTMGEAVESVTEAATEAETGVEELSDNIYDFQVKLNGEVYAFPMSYQDFVDKGWSYDGDETTEISPNSYSSTEVFKKDGLRLYASVINMGINTVPIAEAMIGGVSVDSYQMEDAPDTVLELAKGITFGKSTLEDIKAAYGDPSDSYEGSMYTEYTYSYDYYQEVELQVDTESGVLSSVDVRNFVYDEEANASAADQVSSEPTAEVLAYEAPESLEDDLMEYTVEFADHVYKLPAPVSVFLDNGFTLKTEDSDSVIAGKSFGWVSMIKNNQEFRTIARNYSANAATIENCFVTSIDVSKYDGNLSFLLPRDIKIGMTADELETALDGIHYTKDTDSSENYTYYNIEGEDSSLDGYDMTVDNEDNTVTSIKIAYEPKSLQ